MHAKTFITKESCRPMGKGRNWPVNSVFTGSRSETPKRRKIRLWEKPIRISAIRWTFLAVNLIFVCLIAHTVFLTVQRFQSIYRNHGSYSPDYVSAFSTNSTAINKTEPKNLEDYNLIWGRNLFGTIENRAYTGREIRSVSTSPVPKDFSLRLIGTVVNKIPGVSIAVIVDKSNLSQGLYHEGDKTAGFKIKKIMRNGVIIAAESEDLQLAMESSGSDLIAATSKPNPSHLQEVVKQGHKTTVDDYRLRIKEVQTRLANFDKVMQQTRLYPILGGNNTAGVLIQGIAFNNPLAELGLRNGDIINGLNGETFTDAWQVQEFLQKLKEGGDFSIQIVRRNTPREVHLNIS